MTEGKAIRGLPKEEGKAIRGLPKEGGEGLEGPSQGWRGRHQYGLSKDGEHQYGSHGRGRPLGAFPRREGTSMALIEGEGHYGPIHSCCQRGGKRTNRYP